MSKKTIIILCITIALLVITGVLFLSKKPAKKAVIIPPSVSEEASLLSQLEKIVILPAGETPTIATVSDVDKVKSQAFFARAENGDKVIVFAQAKKAILFRPSLQKVVEITSVTINTPQNASISATPRP